MRSLNIANHRHRFSHVSILYLLPILDSMTRCRRNRRHLLTLLNFNILFRSLFEWKSTDIDISDFLSPLLFSQCYFVTFERDAYRKIYIFWSFVHKRNFAQICRNINFNNFCMDFKKIIIFKSGKRISTKKATKILYRKCCSFSFSRGKSI